VTGLIIEGLGCVVRGRDSNIGKGGKGAGNARLPFLLQKTI